LRPETIAPLALITFVPFYVYALYSGQRPLHVTQINGSLYNVRFGLLMVLPTAIFIGYLVTLVPRRAPRWLRGTGYGGAVLAGLACAGLVLHGEIATLTEAKNFHATAPERANTVAANWLRAHYDDGKVLMESFGNETVTFGSQIPLSQIVYEGSFRQWGPDLADPAGHGIRWIYMRQLPGDRDQVYQRLHGTAALSGYHLVYHDPARLIYQRGAPAGAPVRAPAHPGQLAASPLQSGVLISWLNHHRPHGWFAHHRLGPHRAARHHRRPTPAATTAPA
jgi:hypothetical protein